MVWFLPVIGYLLSLIGVIFYVVSTATNHWYERTVFFSAENLHVVTSEGLWKIYTEYVEDGVEESVTLGMKGLKGYIHLSRACMIIACIVGIANLILAFVAYARKADPVWVQMAGLTLCLTVGSVLTATLWYGAEVEQYSRMSDTAAFKFGYSIILAWVSIPLVVIGGALLTIKYEN
ncbi:claudin-1-like [Ptychodera flava]|uniref:claudin-1-like n=1 Tax=Ptychodera flava TaxID=63121 RepID=UPI00396A299A